MVLDLVTEIMRLYTGVSKTTTSLFNIDDLEQPVYSTGLEFQLVRDFLDFEDVKAYIAQCNSGRMNYKDNVFFTYHTSNNYAYNLVFLDQDSTESLVLVTGPMLREVPTDNLINSKVSARKLTMKEKYSFLEVLYSLPYFSDNDVQATGKILYLMLRPDMKNLTQIMQVTGGTVKETKDYQKYTNAETKDADKVYQFLINLCNYVIKGNTENISDAVFENMHLLTPYMTKGDNYRSLKDICLIACVVSYCFSLRTNFSYEALFVKLWSSIQSIEKMNAVSDIFGQTITTIKDFSHEVRTSANNYSLHTNRIMQYINNHFAEKITLDTLAAYMHLSPVYISSLLKKETEISLSDHINITRINKSKQMLIFGSRSISDISYEVGYNHQTHYNKLFKKYEGMTPREYRNSYGYKEQENFQII